jgi:hypothetical protein
MRREEVALAAARRARSAEDTSTTTEPETTATESGAVERWRSTTAHHFLQRAVNSYQAEVPDTQAASLLLGPRPDFLETLEKARSNPRSREGRMVLKQILPLISVSARPVPWGAVERGSCIGKLPATGQRARVWKGAHALLTARASMGAGCGRPDAQVERVASPLFPTLPRELEARIWRHVWRERDAAVSIQAAVRRAIAREWGLPGLVPEHVMVRDARHYMLRWVHHAHHVSPEVMVEVD